MENKKVNELAKLFENATIQKDNSNSINLKRTKSLAVNQIKNKNATKCFNTKSESFSEREPHDIHKKVKNKFNFSQYEKSLENEQLTQTSISSDKNSMTSTTKESFAKNRAVIEALQKQNFTAPVNPVDRDKTKDKKFILNNNLTAAENCTQFSTPDTSFGAYENLDALKQQILQESTSISTSKVPEHELHPKSELTHINSMFINEKQELFNNQTIHFHRTQSIKKQNHKQSPDIQFQCAYNTEKQRGSNEVLQVSNENLSGTKGTTTKSSIKHDKEAFLNDLASKLSRTSIPQTPANTDNFHAYESIEEEQYEEIEEHYYSEPSTSYNESDDSPVPYENITLLNDLARKSTKPNIAMPVNSFREHIDSSIVRHFRESMSSHLTEISDWESDEEVFTEPTKINSHLPINSDGKKISLDEIFERNKYKIVTWSNAIQCYFSPSLLNNLNLLQMQLYEAKFKLIFSELSHFNTINILNNHFGSKLVLSLSKNEFEIFFGLLPEMRKSSAWLLEKYETCWKEDIYLNDICQILYKYVKEQLDIYIQYNGNQVFVEEIYQNLLRSRSRNFADMLTVIESDPLCKGIQLHTYLLEPAQKITSLLNLLEDIIKYIPQQSPEYEHCQKTLPLLNNAIQRCNQYANKCQEIFLKSRIEKILDFPKNIDQLSLTKDSHRNIIRIGKVELLEINSSLFGRGKMMRKPVHLFLFSDALLIAKKTNERRYAVLHSCFRICLTLIPDVALPAAYRNINSGLLFILRISANHEKKSMELLICCKNEIEKESWCEVFDPPDGAESSKELNNFKNFQVIVTQIYKAKQSAELSLQVRDILQVFIDTDDGKLLFYNTSWFLRCNSCISLLHGKEEVGTLVSVLEMP